MPSLGEIFARRRRYDDLSVSIQEHLNEKIDELMEEGLTREAAQVRARREFGNLTLIEERSREAWQWPTIESIWADVLFALRQLRKTPGMALLAILTLALGIGANTAMFTVIQSVLMRPLPYAHSNRLVSIKGADSWLNYRDVRDQSKLLANVAGYSADIGVVKAPDGSQSIVAPRVTTNVFSMLGVRPLLGRAFTPADGQTNGPQVVLLSEGIWRQSFHANPDIVGQTVQVNGKPYTVVGVMPASFHFPEQIGPDIGKGIWLPLQPTQEMLKERGYRFFKSVGELRPGVTIAQLQQELDAIAARIRKIDSKNTTAFHATPYHESLTGPVRPVLYALFGALALVLLIACANVSNLLIARSLSRQQEFAVRAALGAGRLRLVRQVLSEGLTLSLFGCGAGILLTQAIVVAVRKLPKGTVPFADSIAIHWTVVLVLVAIAIVTTLLSSLLPALLVARADPQAALQSASRGIGSQSIKGRFSGWLVAGEVALSTLLLVGTGLLFHTLWNLEKSELGFDTAHLTTFTAMPPDAAGFSNMAVSTNTENVPTSVAAITYQPILARIRHLPGFTGAALISTPPLSSVGVQSSFEIVDRPKNHRDRSALVSAVSGDYARIMGTPVLSGRMIQDGDVESTPFVAVINQAFAKKYFANENPLGKQISLGGKDTGMVKPYSIVGVLANQVQDKVGSKVLPAILLPQQQVPTTSLFYQALLNTVVSFVVKTQGPIPVAAEMRSVFHKDAPGFALDGFKTMQTALDQNTFSHRLALYLVASFAALAVAMVLAGLYGVLSQLVGYRRHEIGVRMALGATRWSVAQLILRQGLLLIGSGLIIGLLLALGVGRWVKAFLYQVQPTDAFTYIAVAAALSAVGLIATLLPARRAASIEPMQALRED